MAPIEKVSISEEGLGLFAILFGWLVSIFHQGRKIGKLEEQFDVYKAKVLETEQELEKLESKHDADMKALSDWFRTDSGGQKFITFVDHDAICSRNTRHTTDAIGNMTVALETLSHKIEALGEKTQDLKIAVGILQNGNDKLMRK